MGAGDTIAILDSPLIPKIFNADALTSETPSGCARVAAAPHGFVIAAVVVSMSTFVATPLTAIRTSHVGPRAFYVQIEAQADCEDGNRFDSN